MPLEREAIKYVLEQAEERERGNHNDYANMYMLVQAVCLELLECQDMLVQFIEPPLRYSDKRDLVDRARVYLEGWEGA